MCSLECQIKCQDVCLQDRGNNGQSEGRMKRREVSYMRGSLEVKQRSYMRGSLEAKYFSVRCDGCFPVLCFTFHMLKQPRS